MKITIKKLDNGYGFNILNNKSVYSFNDLCARMPLIKSSYQYAWEAQKDASNLFKNHNYHLRVLAMEDMEDRVNVEVAAEDILTDHYSRTLKNIKQRIFDLEGDKIEREKIYQEIKMVITELRSAEKKLEDPKQKSQIKQLLIAFQRMKQKHFLPEMQKDKNKETSIPPPPLAKPKEASSNYFKKTSCKFDIAYIDELLEDYAQKACKAIERKHNDFTYDTTTGDIVIKDIDGNPMLEVRVNKTLTVSGIVPVGKLAETFPIHSVEFYQKYWKPIVESVGHFCFSRPSIVIKADYDTLPDVPKSEQTFTIDGWNYEEDKEDSINLSFKGEKLSWFFEISKQKTAKSTQIIKTAQTKHNEEDYLNAIVKCIDPNLKSIYNRTGEVIQVIPHTDIVEIDINFGRGLGVVRLTEDQIEIVPLS